MQLIIFIFAYMKLLTLVPYKFPKSFNLNQYLNNTGMTNRLSARKNAISGIKNHVEDIKLSTFVRVAYTLAKS